jgi:ankyrin repeat protein
MLIRLIQEKVDVGVLDDSGKSIFSKVIKEDTNARLYEDLLDVCRFKYDSQDNQGRTFMHYAVLNKNVDIVRLIHTKNQEVVNISDNYGLLPVTYAALMGYFSIVEYILTNNNIYITSSKLIPTIVKKKFAPMVNKLDNLKTMTSDSDMLRKITILTDQIKTDLKIE